MKDLITSLATLLQAVVLTGILASFGCTTADTWFDTEDLFKDRPAVGENNGERNSAISPEKDTVEAAPLPTIQQDRLELSLEQAVLYTLRRNRELRVERYAPLIQGSFAQIERGVFDPEVFAELQYSEETATETSRSTEEQFSVEGKGEQLELGVRQQLPTGTEVEATTSYLRSTSNRTPEQQEVRFGLSITQSLLRGFGPAVNLIDVRQAELETQASFYELRGFTEALVSEVEIAYWQYVLATEGIAIFERSLEIAKQQLVEVENRIEVGVIPRNAAAAARAEVARRKQALIEAHSTFNRRRLTLLRLLNASEVGYVTLHIETTSEPRTAAAPLENGEERLQLAARMRPDLNEALLRQRQQRLEVIRTHNGLLPRLDLFIDIGKTGYAESFSSAWNNIDEDNFDLLTGIRFSSYIGNRTAEAKHLAARASRDQAQAAVENLKHLIHLDILLALNETERTSKQIEASRVTRNLQEQTLQAEQERFSVGDVTSLPVAQAQRDLLVSQLAEIEAIIDYRIALVNLYLAEGSLLERRGIRLEHHLHRLQ